MNCRKVSSLLSAYLDRELTGEEMLDIRAHVEHCPLCREELDGLRETKRLLSSLALQTPRAELEKLLVVQAARASSENPLTRMMPEWLVEWWYSVGDAATADERSGQRGATIRLTPVLATAVLSTLGLWLATSTLDTPGNDTVAAMEPDYFPVYIGSGNLTGVPARSTAPLATVGYASNELVPMGNPGAPTAAMHPSELVPLPAPMPVTWGVSMTNSAGESCTILLSGRRSHYSVTSGPPPVARLHFHR